MTFTRTHLFTEKKLSTVMTGKSFCVKIQLDLHAITCPGVWLCPNGTVALQINTLNSNVESRKISPMFPLLFHDKFTFKKVFTGVVTLAELQRSLEREFLYAELIQWATPSSRGIVLATFETNLADVLYPAPCFKGLLAGVDVDLLMEPTKYFPGIIAPKIEISTRTSVEEVLGVCDCTTKAYVVNPKTVHSKNTSCIHRKPPAKGIIRQRRVCHSRGKTKTHSAKHHCQKLSDTECKCICSQSLCGQKSGSQVEKCYHATKGKSKCACEPPLQQRTYKTQKDPDICNTHIFDSCPVCLRYKCYFSTQCDALDEARKNYYIGKEKENTIKDYESLKHIRNSSSDKNFNYSSKADEISQCVYPESITSDLRSKIKKHQKAKDRLYTEDNKKVDDISECNRCCKQNPQSTTKSLEKIYRKMIYQEKIHGREIECA